MLLSLFAVLIPLAVGVYALYAGATGGFDLNDRTSLQPRQRLVLIGIAFAAFGVAYYFYSHPGTLDAAPLDTAAAMASNPPESRGDAAVSAVAEATSNTISGSAPPAAPTSDTAPAASAATVTDLDHDVEVPAPAEAPTATPAAARAAAAAPVAAAAADGELSDSARAIEEEARQRARRPAPAPYQRQQTVAAVEEPAPEPEPRAPTMKATTTVKATKTSPVVEAVANEATESATPARAATAARSARPRAVTRVRRLTIQVRNRLGPEQTAEKLDLAIEGLSVAQVAVDADTPRSTVAIGLPRPGLLHYRLSGHSEGSEDLVLLGEGCIRVRDGARFEVRRRNGSSKPFLEAR